VACGSGESSTPSTDAAVEEAVSADSALATEPATTEADVPEPTAESTSPATTAPPETTTTSTTTTTIAPRVYDFSEVSAIVDAYVTEQGTNGAGLIVVDRDDGVVHEEYWGEFDEDRISLIASSGKVVTASVLMSLDDRGILDVDAPVADVVAWGASHPTITPAQLLSNSSGLVGLLQGLAPESYNCVNSPDQTLQECAEQVFTTPDDDADTIEPDTEFRYGGVQWTVAGAVAEVASGQTWAQLVDETIATPCSLDSLGYTDFQSEFDGDPANLAPTENPNPEGGAYIDAPDFAQVLLMQLRGGMCGDEQVLSPEAVDAMLANRIGDVFGGDTSGPATGPDKGGYGMGWWLDANNGRRYAFGAFGAVPMLDPDNGFGAYLVTEAGSQSGQALAAQLWDPVEAAVLAVR
jgi:CubicO group peptidase (beta-lactamase class C family)